jgi:hypothetical protein
MEILGILFLVVVILGTFKLLGLIFKAGIFLISIPLQILGAVFVAIFAIAIIPIGAVAGVVVLIFAPLLILGFLIYLLVK